MSAQNNNALTTQNTEAFILPDMVGGEFAQSDLAEDMDGLAVQFQRVKIPGGGVLQFEVPGDDPDLGGSNHFFVCQGKIGDIQVTIEYSEPRYAKRNGEYVLVAKGAVLVHFTHFGNTRN